MLTASTADAVASDGHRPQAGRGPDQAGGLAPDHPVVLLDGVIQIADQLQLSGLALHQFGVCAGEQSDRLLAEPCRRHLRGARHEKVARQDRHRVGPVGVDRCRPAAGVRLVDHIVVVEAPDVDQLHGDPGLHRTIVVTGPELGCQQSQQGPEALPSSLEQMLGNLGEEAVVGHGRFEQPLLNAF